MMNRFKKKKIKLLTNEQNKWYENAKICYIYKEKFEDKYIKYTKYRKVRDHCHYTSEYIGSAYSSCYLKKFWDEMELAKFITRKSYGS